MKTITVRANEISQPVYAGAGSRITLTGSGYVEWAGVEKLQDALNGATWQAWPAGSAAGYRDTDRGMAIRVVGTGDCTVTVEEGKADRANENAYWQGVGDNATVVTNTLTGKVEISGPNGTTMAVPSALTNNTAVLFGDSRTANNNITSPRQWSSRGYWTVASQIMGGNLTVIASSGVAGDTIAQQRARVEADLWAYKPNFAIMVGCIYNSISAGVTADSIIADLLAIFVGNEARSITTVYALEPLSPNFTGGKVDTLLRVNDAVIRYAKASNNFILVDTWNVLCDPATGTTLAAYYPDGTHPNTAGSVAIGRAIAASMQPFISTNRYLCNGFGDAFNYVSNGIMSGNNAGGVRSFTLGTGITGTGPDRWTTGRTGSAAAVSSKVARSDFRQGEWWQFAVTGGADGNYVYGRYQQAAPAAWVASSGTSYMTMVKPTVPNGYFYVSTTVAYSNKGGTEPAWPTTLGETVVDGSVTWRCISAWAEGDTVEHSVEFQTSGFNGPAMVSLVVVYYNAGAGVITSAADNALYSGDLPPVFVPESGVLRCPKHTIPEGTVTIDYELRVTTGAGVTGSARFANASFRKVA